jgi:hypothetical protein
VLQDDDTFSSYGIVDGSTVHLVERPTDPSSSRAAQTAVTSSELGGGQNVGLGAMTQLLNSMALQAGGTVAIETRTFPFGQLNVVTQQVRPSVCTFRLPDQLRPNGSDESAGAC